MLNQAKSILFDIRVRVYAAQKSHDVGVLGTPSVELD
jgi:hypothetical protein